MAELPEGFDLAALLAPIAGDAPAGEDLRQDFSPTSLYYRLRDARAEARAAERAADADPAAEISPPQWRGVHDLAMTALTGRSKDLEIAAWLTESLLRSDGLRGLAAGAALMAGLAEGFWDGLHPLPDEDGMATRVAPVAGLNGQGGDGTLIQPLRKLTLFTRPDGSPFALWNYQQSAELSAIGDAARRQQREAAGVVPFETMESEARAAGPAHFAALRGEADSALAAWQGLSDALDRLAGADSPPTSRVRALIEEVREGAARFAPPEPDEAAPAPAAPDSVAAVPAAGSGRLATREDALRALADLAEYFRRTEPHSPLAYTLQEAVRRGRMTWPELMEEIVPDAASRAAILTSLGIRPPNE